MPSPKPTMLPTPKPTMLPSPKPTMLPSPDPTNMPSPQPTPTPVAPTPMTCKDISQLTGLSQTQVFDECKKTTYCKAKYKAKKDKAKCKKCKKSQACCNDNPEGCVYNPANTKQPCA